MGTLPTRADLRATVRAARRHPEPPGAAAARCAHLTSLVTGLGARTIAAYLALPGEPDPAAAVRDLGSRGVAVLLPVLQPDRDLHFAQNDATVITGLLQLPHPSGPASAQALADADLVVVPALSVDWHGVRLGQGGGSYDRALPRRRAGVPAVALLREPEWVAHLESAPWDAPVDAVITPRGIWWMTSGG